MEQIHLAPGYVREILDAYEKWPGQETLPMKMRELMIVLELEVERRYKTAPPTGT